MDEQRMTLPSPQMPATAPPQTWDEETRDSVRHEWSGLMLAIIRRYSRDPSLRKKMWTRVPTVMATKAKQAPTLDDWYTAVLRALGIDQQGTAKDISSLCSTWDRTRSTLRTRGETVERAEKRSMSLLLMNISTITAMAQKSNEEWKSMHPMAPKPLDADGIDPEEDEANE